MELSHRSPEFTFLAKKFRENLINVMQVPDKYEVIFLHGGASAQFSAIPNNLAYHPNRANVVDYFNTGVWSAKAIEEAKKYAQVNIVSKSLHHIEDKSNWNLSDTAKYVYYTTNETITGLSFNFVPDVNDKVLIADMSSDILSKVIQVTDFDVIFAATQKNIGSAGVGILIIKKDLLASIDNEFIPNVLDWKSYATKNSMYNTPATYIWYLSNLVLEWVQRQGGVEAIEKINRRKSNKLYAFIDKSSLYSNHVNKDNRSLTNVSFFILDEKAADEALTSKFIKQAEEQGLYGLKGHKAYGGIRASIYNSMPEEGIDTLIDFMESFANKI